jgi:hypothetical protein
MAFLSIPRGTLPLGLPFPTASSRVGIGGHHFEDVRLDTGSFLIVAERMPPDHHSKTPSLLPAGPTRARSRDLRGEREGGEAPSHTL